MTDNSIASAPAMAEEIKRLRAENERLKGDLEHADLTISAFNSGEVLQTELRRSNDLRALNAELVEAAKLSLNTGGIGSSDTKTASRLGWKEHKPPSPVRRAADMSDIVERLRKSAEPWPPHEGRDGDMEKMAEAADLITSLRAELERKDAALRRFLNAYDRDNPARTADVHDGGCGCMRCARDAAEATFGPEHKASEPDWFWRDLDPDDSGYTISEALSHVPHGVVCAIHSSYAGPSFFAAVVPVLDPESDNTEEIRADTEDECVAAVKERFAARAALSAQKEEEA